jgi:hypothetical protein
VRGWSIQEVSNSPPPHPAFHVTFSRRGVATLRVDGEKEKSQHQLAYVFQNISETPGKARGQGPVNNPVVV